MDLIILSGLPASGKSTVARMLQTAFPYPILEKDRIKECLFDTLGFQSHEEKRRLDAAAARILLQTAEELLAAGGSVILDNNFDIAAQVEEGSIAHPYVPYGCVGVDVTANGTTTTIPIPLPQRGWAVGRGRQRHFGQQLRHRCGGGPAGAAGAAAAPERDAAVHRR